MNKRTLVSLLGGVALLGLSGVASASPPACYGPLGTAANLAKLNGSFGFNFSGGDDTQGTGERLVGSGVFTSDGKGHVTTMTLNVNYDGAETTLSLAGPYSIAPTGAGFMSLTIAGCPSSCTGHFPGGQDGIDLDFTMVPNVALFAADGGDVCYSTG